MRKGFSGAFLTRCSSSVEMFAGSLAMAGSILIEPRDPKRCRGLCRKSLCSSLRSGNSTLAWESACGKHGSPDLQNDHRPAVRVWTQEITTRGINSRMKVFFAGFSIASRLCVKLSNRDKNIFRQGVKADERLIPKRLRDIVSRKQQTIFKLLLWTPIETS